MINRKLTEKDQMVITIINPKIHFSESRLEGNQEIIGSEFCDSQGEVYVLKDIVLGDKQQNLWQRLFDKSKFKVWGSYHFRRINRQIDLPELKEIAIELMRFETVEDAQEKYAAMIMECKNHEDVIGQFGFGMQA